MDKEIFYKLFELSKEAARNNEVPISAALVCDGKIVASAYNKRNISNNVFDHSEIIVISEYAKKNDNWHLNNCDLYVMIEPCDMCKLFIKESRIRNVYYLLDKPSYKKMYSKTNFINCNEYNELINEYKNIIDLFWKNKR